MWDANLFDGTVLRSSGNDCQRILWLIHGFGESSLCYVPLFSTDLSTDFRLLAPDWPGAGVTPARPEVNNLDTLAAWLESLISSYTPKGRLGLVGHSVGSAVAVKVALRMPDRIAGVFSIEGNLTKADAYLSGEAMNFENPMTFKHQLQERARNNAANKPAAQAEAWWRYHASVTFADPNILWKLGRDVKAQSVQGQLGDEYCRLTSPALYYWSPRNAPDDTQEYVLRKKIAHSTYSGGHWPMVESPKDTASQIDTFFKSHL